MSVRLKNTANDRRKTPLHRVAAKFDPEPTIGDRRLRMGETMEISNEHYARIKDFLSQYVASGVLEVTFPATAYDPKDFEVKQVEVSKAVVNPAAVQKIEFAMTDSVPPVENKVEVKVETPVPPAPPAATEPAGASVAPASSPTKEKNESTKKDFGKKKLF